MRSVCAAVAAIVAATASHYGAAISGDLEV